MAVLVDGELVLYGFVGESYFGKGFTAAEVMDALAELGRDTDVPVRINSGGGYAYEGIAIYNALLAHRGQVSVQIDAVAASSASVIAMAGDSITMRAGANMMLHDPSGVTFGTEAEHQKSIKALARLASGMASIYAEKSGEDATAIRADMKSELWLTGAEAVERGFATATSGQAAEPVAAFDYRVYANAPRPLVALAEKERWTFNASHLSAARAAPFPAQPKEPSDMAQTPPPAAPTPTAAAPAQPPAAAPAPVAPPAPAPATASDDVKTRIKAILDDDAAQGRETLARHLAFDTEMPADAAVATLKAAAADAPGTPETPADALPDPAAYQANRSAASALAQPAPQQPAKPKAKIDTSGIYARRAKQEA